MRTILYLVVLCLLMSLPATAQQPDLQDALLDHLTGVWVLQGVIAGGQTTHDIVAEWVLGHQYLRIHEVSREKSSDGAPVYEAIVFIGWDQPSSQYACLWLDSTGGGGLSAGAIGHAERSGGEMAFVFKGSDGSTFHTTFAYGKDSDTWQWLMDAKENGKRQPFARVTLTRPESRR
ncbi:MAG: hypothetical protein KJ970_15195 [Candidatus Eisenbacteria bacterium]|uniref:DUF1579 domain-containing protein n=1 Tax=Eiseniibacteriota bacterium TaxID=2212470 RepID=A0A948RZ35_UNCEI|nr:hypothetical protein [Candidatus Eisenbacteria bacterium]MBU1978043.1 hypothetical protein [Gammaproteobacteria bacterium]MBU2692267.1 hypothetical protein [Candidatus Eisenbacteria bacterium]